MILTDSELRDLTGFTRADAQRRELDFMGIQYKVRRDGTLVVLWTDLTPSGSKMVSREPQLHL